MESEDSPSPSPVTGDRFVIKDFKGVAMWSWDIVVDVCGICRNHVMELCLECQAGTGTHSQTKCSVAWGECNHAFHAHCIDHWLKTRNVCPLDNRPWVLQKHN